MEFRTINNKRVSLLGMGCMRFPKIEGLEEVDINKTEEIIDFAYQNGVNYYDTAYPYHNGKSEIIIGEVLKKYPRESFYLADKLPIWNCSTIEDVKRIFEEQLIKCQVEYFDFYLCHAMNLERLNIYKKLEVFPFLIEMKKQGKIKNLGFSFHDAAQNILPIIQELNWDFAQIQMNYLDYDMQDAKQQYELLTEHNISVIVMEPVRGGMLANICRPAEDILKEARPHMSNASWALRYVASFSNVKVILSGMSTLEQVKDNIDTLSKYEPMNAFDFETIERIKKIILGNDFIPCTGCRYCMPCPFHVDIPKIFKVYNLYGIHKDKEKFKKDIEPIEDICLPKSCKKCKKCLKECPQHIDIPLKLEKINQIL